MYVTAAPVVPWGKGFHPNQIFYFPARLVPTSETAPSLPAHPWLQLVLFVHRLQLPQCLRSAPFRSLPARYTPFHENQRLVVLWQRPYRGADDFGCGVALEHNGVDPIHRPTRFWPDTTGHRMKILRGARHRLSTEAHPEAFAPILIHTEHAVKAALSNNPDNDGLKDLA